FTASGGQPPYEYTMHSGSGSVDRDTGDYTAPGTAGTDKVKVTDDIGNSVIATVSIAVPASLEISPSSIEVYVNTSTTFSVTGGTSPYNFSVPSGSGSIGTTSGVYTAPSSAGTATVQVEDSTTSTSDAVVTILEHLRISPSAATVSTGGSTTFSASGGKSPYTFSMHSGNGSVDSSTGDYTAPGSAGTDEVKVTDDSGNFDIATVTVSAPSPFQISPTSVTVSVGESITFTAAGGTTPYEFTRYSGVGTVNLTTGEYSSPSPGTAVVRVTDDAGNTRDATVTVTSTGPLTIDPSSAVIEQNTAFNFSANGGSPPYSFSVASGQGSINSSSGTFSAPSSIGTSTVRVTDSLSNINDASVQIAPAAPTELVADGSFGGPHVIRLTWADNSSGEDGFKIERKTPGGDFSEVATADPNTTTYDDDSLSPSQFYGYRVRAYSGSVHSGFSNESYDSPN
ncbi:MAG: hypothetical protein ACLFRY_15970, partial [Spirochaetia bacterium]